MGEGGMGITGLPPRRSALYTMGMTHLPCRALLILGVFACAGCTLDNQGPPSSSVQEYAAWESGIPLAAEPTEEGDPDKVSGNPDVLRPHFCPEILRVGAIHRLNYSLRRGFGWDLVQTRPHRPHL